MSRTGPPERRTGPHHKGPFTVETTTTNEDIVPPTTDNNVVNMPRINPRRRAELGDALLGVPIAMGMASGIAATLLPFELGPSAARRRLEELRRKWHADVDQFIDMALDDVGRAS